MKLDALNGLKVKHVAIGRCSIHILCDDGQVYGWGANTYGQLFAEDLKLVQRNPVNLTSKIPETVVKIESGAFHTLFLTANNKVFGIGDQSYGQLGTAAKQQFSTLTELKFETPSSEVIRDISCGSLFSCALVGPSDSDF